MSLGVDVDGVLGDFFEVYERLAIELSGRDLFGDKAYPAQLPQCWNWPESFGYTDQEMSAVWDHIKSDPGFWLTENLLPGGQELITELCKVDDQVYFITDRPGVNPQLQTAIWLHHNGYMLPSVVISSGSKGPTKGDCCKLLKVSRYVDDKAENILDVLEKSPDTKAFLLAYPYNQFAHDEIKAKGGVVIDKAVDFLEVKVG